MRFRSSLKPTSTLIDLTPLIDVILLILVFFILTADILPLKSLNIENPKLSQDSAPLTTQIIVIVDAQQVVYLGHRKDIIDIASLPALLTEEINRIKQEHPGADPTVVLSIDKRVDYGTFLRLFASTQQCADTVRLVYKPEDDIAQH